MTQAINKVIEKNIPICVDYDCINYIHEVLNYSLVYTHFLHSKIKIWADKSFYHGLALKTRIKLQLLGKLTPEIFSINQTDRETVQLILL